MYKINIPVDKTTDAIHWAGRNFSVGSFTVRHDFPSTSYIFMFNNVNYFFRSNFGLFNNILNILLNLVNIT